MRPCMRRRLRRGTLLAAALGAQSCGTKGRAPWGAPQQVCNEQLAALLLPLAYISYCPVS